MIALLAVFFATGYYNLTAVELIAGVLVFSWIIVFLRTVSVAAAGPDDDGGDALAPAAGIGARVRPSS